jgi:D-alanyl-D-alanine carboxypeptidase/D-alanyl-D-alanine-endopeptidase (penicillin-binding protein 4)
MRRAGAILAAALAAAPAAAQMADPRGEEARRLEEEVRAILAGPGRAGVLVVSLDRGDTLVSLAPDEPLAPASGLKLYSTAAALSYLGPAFRWSTHLLAAGDTRDGVLHGDLVLFGTGDPTLSARLGSPAERVMEAFADTLAARGVREVRGDVVGDGSFFDDRRTGLAWNPADLDEWYGAPVAALSANENMVTVRVSPGDRGEAGRVSTSPATSGLGIDNGTTTVRRGGGISVGRGPERLSVSGRVGRGGGARTLPVPNPARYAAAVLRAALERRGIRVTGATRAAADPAASPAAFHGGSAPAGRVVATHLSAPLSVVAQETNHVSHNLFADALLKTVGRAAGGEGSWAAGMQAVRRLLEQEAGAGGAALRMEDGSGLSRLDRVTARMTVHLLARMAAGADSAVYRASLPEAATPEGLTRRMRGSPAARNLRAKTGTIRGVSSLSGYVTAANGERLAFSILQNDVPETAVAKRAEDAVGARLAAFSRP